MTRASWSEATRAVMRENAANLRAEADRIDYIAGTPTPEAQFRARQAIKGRISQARRTPEERHYLAKKAAAVRWGLKAPMPTGCPPDAHRNAHLQRRVSIDTLPIRKQRADPTWTESNPQRVLREPGSRPRGGGGLRPIGDFLRRSGT